MLDVNIVFMMIMVFVMVLIVAKLEMVNAENDDNYYDDIMAMVVMLVEKMEM